MGSAKSKHLAPPATTKHGTDSVVTSEPPPPESPTSERSIPEPSTSGTSESEETTVKLTDAPLASAPSKKTCNHAEFPESLKGKRILLCTESFGPVNGVSRTTVSLVTHLRQHGAQVAVVAPHNHTGKNTFVPPYVAHRDPKRNIELRLRGYTLPFNPELSIVYPVRLSALIARTFGWENPPDLIYLASPASLGFQVMLQMQQWPKEKQIPIICNFQTDLAGYCSILFPEPLGTVANRTFGAVQSYLFKDESVKKIYYPSRFVRRYLEAQGVAHDKMERLGRGVDTQMFSPSRREEGFREKLAPNGEIILICVSRVAGEKGFDFLAKAATLLDHKGLNYKLLIVGGNGKPAVEQSIKKLFEPLTNKGKVIFAGCKTGEALAAAFAAGDIFLHCSVTETFGLVVLESMASGVPVVARDEGGPSDVIVSGKTGFLVPPNDLESFVVKVLRLAYNPDLREQMGNMARKTACNATWEKINNKAAWGMADIIGERWQSLDAYSRARDDNSAVNADVHIPVEDGGTDDRDPLLPKRLQQTIASNPLAATVENAWENHKVEARLLWGLAVIMFFWFWTGLYVIFIELALWTRAKISRGDLDVTRTENTAVKLDPTMPKAMQQSPALSV